MNASQKSTMEKNKFSNVIIHALLTLLYSVGCFLPAIFSLEIITEATFFTGIGILLFFSLLSAVLNNAGRKKRCITSAAILIAAAGAVFAVPSLRKSFMEIVYAIQASYNGLELPLQLLGTKAAFCIAMIIGLLVLQFSLPAGILALISLITFSTENVLPLVYAPLILSLVLIFAVNRIGSRINFGKIFALVAALAVAITAILPADKPLSVPLKNFGDNVREKIRDTFFFTSTRNLFSLANEGYYPQGPNQMGGKPEIRHDNVMMVITPEKTYLRGVIKDDYSGRCWNETLGGRRYLWMSPQWENDRNTIFGANLPSENIRNQSSLMIPQNISVRMLEGATSTLYVPQKITELRPGGALTPYFNKASEVYITRDLQPGDTYSVSAPLFTGGEAGLGTIVNAALANDDPYMANISRIYLKLPGHLQSELQSLVDRIVSGCSTPYEKAVAIKNYISRNYRYTTDVENQPENQDFVSTFLLQTREGYCVHFATAMTILARMAGLPARYIEGYVAVPDEKGHAVVTGEDAHAWAEIYFRSFGWITFDATPVFSDSDSAGNMPDKQPENDPESSEPPSENSPEPSSHPTAEGSSTPTPTPSHENKSPKNTPNVDREKAQQNKNMWWLPLLIVLLLAAIALRIWMILPENMARGKNAQQKFGIYMAALYDALAIIKLHRQPDESPAAFMARVDSTGVSDTDILSAGLAESKMIYGKADCTNADCETAKSCYKSVLHKMKRNRKAAYILARAFAPWILKK